jgi:hypothetical protein
MKRITAGWVLGGVATYVVGVYVVQRFMLKRILPLPDVLDPLGTWLGYPPDVQRVAAPPPGAPAFVPTPVAPTDIALPLPAPPTDIALPTQFPSWLGN